MCECVKNRERELTLMERDERVEGTKDLSKLALCHDVQLQHGLIIHLGAQVKTICKIGKRQKEKEKVHL